MLLRGSTLKCEEADACQKGSVQVAAVTKQAEGVPGLPIGAAHLSGLHRDPCRFVLKQAPGTVQAKNILPVKKERDKQG